MTFDECMQIISEQKRAWIIQSEKELLQSYESKDWERFRQLVLDRYEVHPLAFRLIDDIPEDMRYDLTMKAYMHHGDSVPAVRKAVRKARRWGEPKLPPGISKKEIITVYRAGEETIDKAKYRISWTTSRKVANFFLNEYGKRHANYLYKGKIRTSDIIGYIDDRKEKEILQYGKVFDIMQIDTAKPRE